MLDFEWTNDGWLIARPTVEAVEWGVERCKENDAQGFNNMTNRIDERWAGHIFEAAIFDFARQQGLEVEHSNTEDGSTVDGSIAGCPTSVKCTVQKATPQDYHGVVVASQHKKSKVWLGIFGSYVVPQVRTNDPYFNTKPENIDKSMFVCHSVATWKDYFETAKYVKLGASLHPDTVGKSRNDGGLPTYASNPCWRAKICDLETPRDWFT